MKLWIDTNVILDVLSNRLEFVEDSKKVFKLCEVHKAVGYVSVLTITNIIYILRKELDNETISSLIEKLSLLFTIVDYKADDLITATQLGFNDFEDAVQSACAKRIKVDYIVTRNIKDFKGSSVMAVKPSELLERI